MDAVSKELPSKSKTQYHTCSESQAAPMPTGYSVSSCRCSHPLHPYALQQRPRVVRQPNGDEYFDLTGLRHIRGGGLRSAFTSGLGRRGGPARDLLPNTPVPFSFKSGRARAAFLIKYIALCSLPGGKFPSEPGRGAGYDAGQSGRGRTGSGLG